MYVKHVNNFLCGVDLFFDKSSGPIGKSASTYLTEIPPHAFPDPLLKFTEVFLARWICLCSRSSHAGKTDCILANEVREKFISPFQAVLAYWIVSRCAVAKDKVAAQKLLEHY